ncbi:hypothetical protein ACFOU0_13915 [Salinicoccus sesuvii]|uniref:Uncharacterized protein n=1 Tax=Salinicoccus sesuvii TaxID=868281 RepID=A0ABV7N8M1_9STAP
MEALYEENEFVHHNCLIVLTGCGNERNSIETISLSDRESHLANALAEITFAYELEHKNLENPHLNIWVEEYNYGEKQEEDLLSHGLVRTEKSENEHFIF